MFICTAEDLLSFFPCENPTSEKVMSLEKMRKSTRIVGRIVLFWAEEIRGWYRLGEELDRIFVASLACLTLGSDLGMPQSALRISGDEQILPWFTGFVL